MDTTIETTEPVQDLPPIEAQAPETTPEPQIEAQPEETLKEKFEGMAAKVETKAEEKPSEENLKTEEVVAAFTPDFKFKVRDEEHAMDDWVKDHIKDEATQKKFQDLYTRGHGLELAKTERDEVKQKLGTLEESLQHVNELVQKGDARSFIEALGLPKKMFLDYAINEFKFQELPAEEKQKIEAQRQQELAMQQLQMQNNELQDNYQAEARQRRTIELETALGGEYQGAAQAYDQRAGTPGAFRKLVVERGIFHHHVNGVDIPVSQAIQEAILLGGVQAGTPQATQQPVEAGTPTVQPQQQKKVLPNIQGQGTSPTKTSFNSLDSLKAHRKQKYGF